MKILIVCSAGGHLTQALALRSWWGNHERSWVTFPTEDARSRLADERVVECHYPTVRNIPNLLRNIGLAREVLAREKPDLVFSTGAALALPFFLQAGRFGARTAFLEPVDRIASASLSGLLVYPFADEVLVQWPDLTRVYPDANPIGVVL